MQKHISHWDMPLLLFVSSCHLNLEVVFFSHFLNYFICQQTFGIHRKAIITSNDFIIMIIIIIIIIIMIIIIIIIIIIIKKNSDVSNKNE